MNSTKIKRRPTLKDMAKPKANQYSWYLDVAAEEERQYVKMLNPKAVLEYIKQREQEVFIDNL